MIDLCPQPLALRFFLLAQAGLTLEEVRAYFNFVEGKEVS